ncbi:hypothetical protein OSTOST_01995 [Ostertagia ostertagi]
MEVKKNYKVKINTGWAAPLFPQYVSTSEPRTAALPPMCCNGSDPFSPHFSIQYPVYPRRRPSNGPRMNTIRALRRPILCKATALSFIINTFTKEACLRLCLNNTSLHEPRVRWKSLELGCDPETDLFTRGTIHKMIDSKRCFHKGSCIGDKCGSTIPRVLSPNLRKGTNIRAIRRASNLVEDWVVTVYYLVRGAYSTESTPHQSAKCLRSSAAIGGKARLRAQKRSTTVVRLTPNLPTQCKSFRMTLTSLAFPPTPLLSTYFISDPRRTALCTSAETHVNCRCTDFSISDWFYNIRNQLPVVFPAITLSPHRASRVQARVFSMVTAEVVITFQDAYKPALLIDEATCEIGDADLTGCYGCAKGAFSTVTCTASKDDVQAVSCERMGFTIPCNTTGVVSTLRFASTTAQASPTCSVSCGGLSLWHLSSTSRFSNNRNCFSASSSTSSPFFDFQSRRTHRLFLSHHCSLFPSMYYCEPQRELPWGLIVQGFDDKAVKGILKFVTTQSEILNLWLKGETISNNDFAWPDFWHIFTVFAQWDDDSTNLCAPLHLWLKDALVCFDLDSQDHFLFREKITPSLVLLQTTSKHQPIDIEDVDRLWIRHTFSLPHQSSASATTLEKDQANSLRMVHGQIKVTKTFGVSWQHHLEQKSIQEAPAGEQVLLISKFLRTALITRELLWSWTQRFLMFDSLYPEDD